jgi:hypothetical protein
MPKQSKTEHCGNADKINEAGPWPAFHAESGMRPFEEEVK